MNEFESYSFSRIYRKENIEFFFILGVNDSDNFDEYWDGRLKEVLGYAVIHNDFHTTEQTNYIYLINNENHGKTIKYTKQFLQQMSLSEELSARENFKILKTTIKQRVLSYPYTDFIKMVVQNEIPEFDSK